MRKGKVDTVGRAMGRLQLLSFAGGKQTHLRQKRAPKAGTSRRPSGLMYFHGVRMADLSAAALIDHKQANLASETAWSGPCRLSPLCFLGRCRRYLQDLVWCFVASSGLTIVAHGLV